MASASAARRSSYLRERSSASCLSLTTVARPERTRFSAKLYPLSVKVVTQVFSGKPSEAGLTKSTKTLMTRPTRFLRIISRASQAYGAGFSSLRPILGTRMLEKKTLRSPATPGMSVRMRQSAAGASTTRAVYSRAVAEPEDPDGRAAGVGATKSLQTRSFSSLAAFSAFLSAAAVEVLAIDHEAIFPRPMRRISSPMLPPSYLTVPKRLPYLSVPSMLTSTSRWSTLISARYLLSRACGPTVSGAPFSPFLIVPHCTPLRVSAMIWRAGTSRILSECPLITYSTTPATSWPLNRLKSAALSSSVALVGAASSFPLQSPSLAALATASAALISSFAFGLARTAPRRASSVATSLPSKVITANSRPGFPPSGGKL
eukprot:comp21955_c0_seq1/m.50123 comp21955_c0_seq1/g.50123  ORF comp21955_c0_seq1/g.50123 comp21955_c0_seq1/m.50123 type:complete len:374 (+) comp21955_c0_seq1:1380-2501(+)